MKDVRLTLLVLFGSVGILLLIACTNVANLLLSRGAARQTEFAIRLSIGATNARLVRQLVTENVVLAFAGGVLGLLLAIWGTRILLSIIPVGVDLPPKEIGIDVRIFLFASLVTIVTALLFGVMPSVQSAGFASGAIQQVARGSSAGPGRHRIGDALIVVEVALAVILLTGAGLLGRSFRELTRVQPGFQADHVLTMRTTLSASNYGTHDRIRAFTTELLTRVESLPGVLRAGVADYLPMSRFGVARRFEIDGRGELRNDDQKFSWVSVVGGRYFEAMGIRLLRGRVPGDADTDKTPPVFVIDENLARRYWPNADPIGTRLVWHRDDGERFSGVIHTHRLDDPVAGRLFYRRGRHAGNVASRQAGNTRGSDGSAEGRVNVVGLLDAIAA